ncbi:recombinase family protein [uncultured Tenacibaculum sp.]|uniref:recombinase family protein n=1 Tax=uncultured Tenacibaculum sp. TaxID=174713 RepID=UPI00260A1745|nr:recombinase family protein [uncultured Tenacibaculum sp.]
MLAIYTRLSKLDEESNSIHNQLREGKEFAKKNKYDIIKEYNERMGVSGTLDIEDRPQLLELIADIKKGDIKAVWMRNQNRLDRNTGVFYLFITAVKKNNVEVFFADGDSIDFNDPTTLLQTSIISSLNQYQAQLQSVQTKKALRDNAQEGKAWGILPYGYCTDENKLIVINEVEAKVVKEIFNLCCNGWGARRISTYLTDKGYPTRYSQYDGTISVVNKYTKEITKRNKKDIIWSVKTVLNMLKNTWYIGERTYAGSKYPAPPIIDIEVFENAQRKLVENKNIKKSGKKTTYNYLLKGLIICGKCGRNYYGRHRPPKEGKTYSNDNYYMCSSKRYKHLNCGNRSIDIPFIEGLVWDRFFKYKELNKLIDEHFDTIKVDEVLNDLNTQLKKLEEKLGKFSKERQNTIKLNAKELITFEQTEQDLKRINLEENQTKGELQNIKEQIKNYTDSIALKEQQKELENIENDISFNDKKELVNKYIKQVLILHHDDKNYYKITIKFNIEIKPEVYHVTTFKKEVYRVIEGFGVLANKINVEDLKGRFFELPKKTTNPFINKLNESNNNNY